MPGIKGMQGSGGPRPGAGRKTKQCQSCRFWTVDTPEQSKAAKDPVGWWGSCSQLRIQTEQDFLCKKYEYRPVD